MKCPKCGNTKEFDISYRSIATFVVDPDGFFEFTNDWGAKLVDDDSYCFCEVCKHEGYFYDFEEGYEVTGV